MCDHRPIRLTPVLCALLLFATSQPVCADLLDPLDFTSLGTLNLTSGAYTINTDALTLVDNAAPGVPLFSGVVDDQNGMADSFGGVPGPLGIPEIAVFTFDSISLASGASFTITGTRALALLSQTDATIDTTLDVSGKPGSHSAGGAGGPGGFAGGFVPTLDGLGPGGGTGGPGNDGLGIAFNIAAGGSFGGMGQDGTSLNPGGVPIPNEGMTYGSPAVDVLQGGSGGGGMDDIFLTNGNIDSGGGGAGGALEIGAAAQITVGSNGNLVADGSIGAPASGSGPVAGGNASGGSIRLHGVKVMLNGTVSASDSDLRAATQANQSVGQGGGGRVRVSGYDFGGDNGEFIPGITDPATIVVTGIDASNGLGNRSGTIALEPIRTLVLSGMSFELNGVIDATTSARRLFVIVSDVRVMGGGEVTVPAAGIAFDGRIELTHPQARIAGPGTLTNGGEIRGTGQIEAPLANDVGGQLNAVNDELTFTATVVNNVGGQINAINSTLNFDSGLTNDGELNLINTVVNGAVSMTGGAELAGSNTFTGAVGGAGDFSGTGEAVFTGSYSPGDSPAEVTFDGDVTFASSNTLSIELAGDGGVAGSDFDQLVIAGNVTLDGMLDVSLIDPFPLSPGLSFEIIDADASLSGQFRGLAEGGLVGNFGGTNLLITYAGGDGNDVALLSALPGDFDLDSDVDGTDFLKWQRGESPRPFTSADLADWEANYGVAPGALVAPSMAVPEPSALCLLAICAVLGPVRSFRRGFLP